MPTAPPPSTIDYDQFVDARIKQTRSAVKVTDLASGMATLLAAGLAFLLVAALVEHWVVPGGYSVGERAGLLGVVLVGGVIYSARRLLPVIVGRVNPLYAAIEIERDAPELKNSLVNLLQLRSSGATSKVIQQTLEQQAAERLATASEATIDREGLLRVGYVLLGLVAVIGLYVVISPKDFFATAGRIALPWADIAAPTRVQIMDLTPGAATVSQGDTLEVSARLSGLQEGDIVELIYSARDGRTIDRRVTMQTDESGIRYRIVLGGATRLGNAAGSALGLQTNLQYRLVAGDARTPLYRVQVLSSPTIAPLKVVYDYPDYTGYADRTVEGVGDLEAIEGTRVKLTVEANLPIESAQIDLDADGTPDVRLRTDGQTAAANFTLRRDGERPGVPRESVYVIRFTSAEGQSNTNPARHRLVVKPDLVPEAAILLPEEEMVDVALNDEVEIEIEARDPDFSLATVRLLGEVNSRSVLSESLLGRSQKAHKGKFFVRRTISPEQLRMSVGDVLTYWVEATDNRSPEANRVVTARKQLRVVASDPQKGEAGAQQDNQQGEASDETNGDPSQSSDGGQQGENSQQENGEPSASAAGDEQQGEQQENGEPRASATGEEQDQQQGEQQQSDEADPSGGSQSDPPQGGLQGNGKENQDSQSGEDQQGGASGKSSGDDKKEGEGDAGENPSGENPSGGEGQTGERRPGKPTGGAQQPVADDGSDDGAAFDRIQKHLDEQGSDGKSSEKSPQQGDTSEASSSDNTASDNAASEEGDPSKGETGDAHPGTEDSADQSRDAPADSPERSVEGEAPEDGTGQEGQQSDSQSSESGESGGDESSTQETTTPHDGTGSTGQSQAADEGTGQSADEGAGDRSGQAGDEQAAGEETGQSSGDQPGEGSQSSEDPSSNGGEPGDSSDGTTSGEPKGEGEPSDAPAADADGSPSSSNGPDGQGQESNGRRDPNDQQESSQGDDVRGGERDPASQLPDNAEPLGEPGGDEANLDYARKQTDLVLKRLSEQLDENAVDNELLDKLGWTEEDLRRFVSRWQDRQERAAAGDARGKSELDSALRSLGLSRTGPTKTGKLEKDQLRDLHQRTRTTIPPALRDRLRPYNRGISTSRDE